MGIVVENYGGTGAEGGGRFAGLIDDADEEVSAGDGDNLVADAVLAVHQIGEDGHGSAGRRIAAGATVAQSGRQRQIELVEPLDGAVRIAEAGLFDDKVVVIEQIGRHQRLVVRQVLVLYRSGQIVVEQVRMGQQVAALVHQEAADVGAEHLARTVGTEGQILPQQTVEVVHGEIGSQHGHHVVCGAVKSCRFACKSVRSVDISSIHSLSN